MSTAVMIQKKDASLGTGRLVGVLLLAHLAGGLIVPFVMLHPLVSPPGFLVSAAGVANQVRAAVLLFFVGSAMAIAVASAGWRVFSQYSPAMAFMAGGTRSGSFYVAGGGQCSHPLHAVAQPGVRQRRRGES